MKFEFNRKEYERKFLNPGGYVGKIINVKITSAKTWSLDGEIDE